MSRNVALFWMAMGTLILVLESWQIAFGVVLCIVGFAVWNEPDNY